MADEAEVVSGGPEGGEGTKADAAGTAAPEMVDLGGVQVPKEMAAYLGPLVDQFTGQIAALEGQLRLAQAQKAAPAAPAEEYDYETMLFTDPKGALERLRSELKAEIAAESDSKTNMAKLETEFWSLFYSDHPELKEDDFIVRAVLQRDFKKLENLTNDAAMKKIAEETKKILIKNRKTEPDNKKKVALEGSGGTTGGGEFDTTVKPAQISITQLLKERRSARSKTG